MNNRAITWARRVQTVYPRKGYTEEFSMFFGLFILTVHSLDYKKVRFSFSLLFVC